MKKRQAFYQILLHQAEILKEANGAGLPHSANYTVFHMYRDNKVLCVMKLFDNIRKHLTKKKKTLKKKAITGLELLAAGGLLTGGSRIVEKLTEDSSPQISASEVTYNGDSGMALIKFETVQGEEKMTNLKIL